MQNTLRRIDGITGIVPEPNYTSANGLTVQTVVANAIYTGNDTLSAYITQGNSGVGGYCYLICAAAATKVSRIIGCVQLTSTTWAIQTDGDLTGASNSAFSVVNTPMYGYFLANDGGGTATLYGVLETTGVSMVDGESINQPSPSYADAYNIGETQSPIYVDASSTDILVKEILGAPATV